MEIIAEEIILMGYLDSTFDWESLDPKQELGSCSAELLEIING